MSREAVLTITLTAAFGIAGIFGNHLPPIYEARQMPEDPDFRAVEVSLLIIASILAAVLAQQTGSSLPIAGVLGMAIGMIGYYEWALRANGGN